MTRAEPTSDRHWPKSGFWAAAARPMFALVAIWAVLAVAIWQWLPTLWSNLPAPVMWHLHEMTFGFAGAAVAGYLLTAVSSWTGRAPVNGRPLMVVAGLWVSVRIGLIAGDAVSYWLVVVPAVVFFWSIALLMWLEARDAGRGQQPVFVAFCLLAGIGSATWIAAMSTGGPAPVWSVSPVLGFAFLLVFVGGRMVSAFLVHSAKWSARPVVVPPDWPRIAVLGLIVTAAVLFLSESVTPAALALIAAGVCLALFVARWPLFPARTDLLLAMLVLSFLWLPLGLLLWGAAAFERFLAPVEAQHALMMGAMGGLIFAISARSFARRSDTGLKARRGTGLAFALVMASVPLRMGGLLDAAALMWCAGWGLYAWLVLRHAFGPLPRPVFSGARR